MSEFTFIDLFAGVGGFHLALNELRGECVFASEIDEKARATYRDNHGIEPHGDIRDITGSGCSEPHIRTRIPKHDILAAGFPCQPFSLAGVSARNALGQSHGLMDDTQGTLFYDIARIAKARKPKALILENVSNIVRHDGGRTFQTLRAVIEDELDYTFFAKVLNSETLVPQRRKRCFIVAFRDPVKGFDFPTPSGDPIPLRMALENDVDDSFTISDKSWEGHKRRTSKNLARGTGFTAFEADLDRPSNTLVARYYKDGKECLVPQPGKNPRMLTPRECARLQGFPDTFRPHPSKSVAYKQFGNAVPVPLAKLVAAEVLKSLSEGKSDGQNQQSGPLTQHVRHQEQGYEAGTLGKALSA